MRHLFNSTVEILESITDIVEGARVQTWQKSSSNFDPSCGPGEMKCRLDLIFLRPGKDAPAPAAAGRSPDRTGIMYCSNTPELQGGQIVRVIRGPHLGASFLLKMRPDEAQDFRGSHHIEVQVFETNQAGFKVSVRSAVMIRIERLTDGIDKEVDRLADGPKPEDFMKFDAVLTAQFQATQRAVHVQTRSLKTSGKSSSDTSGNTWEGEISYGGPSEGIHNPVDYAEYERERGLTHDFLAPAEALSARYITAMNEFLGG